MNTPVSAPVPKSSTIGGFKSRLAPRWLRVALSIILTLVALGVGGRGFDTLSRMKPELTREEPQRPVFRVETFQVERVPVQRFISSFGTPQPDRQVTVAAEVAGRVVSMERIKVGSLVKGPNVTFDADGKSNPQGGDVIVQIDPQTYQQRLAQVEALLAQDQVDLDQLRQQHESNQQLLTQQQARLKTLQGEVDRFKRLIENGGGRDADVQRAELELQQYREGMIKTENELELFPIKERQWSTRRESHLSDLELAKIELDKATVRVPFSGIVNQVMVEEGQYVRPGEPLIEITEIEKVEIEIPVPVSDANILRDLLVQGLTPRAELAVSEESFTQAEGGVVWSGEVRRLAPVANEQTRTMMAYVEVDNRAQTTPLHPGTFVMARIQAEVIGAEHGVLIPRDAIVAGKVLVTASIPDALSQSSIQSPAATDNKPPMMRQTLTKRVTVLRKLQTFALVSGLEAGDEIVMTNLDIVSEGALVDVRQQNSLTSEFDRLNVPYLKQMK